MQRLKAAYWFAKHEIRLADGDVVKAEEYFNNYLKELNEKI